MAVRRTGTLGLVLVVAGSWPCLGDPSCDAAQLVQGSARVQPAAGLAVATEAGLSSESLVEAIGEAVCPDVGKMLGRKVSPEEVLQTMSEVSAQNTPPMSFTEAEPLPEMSKAERDFEQLQARFKTFLQEGEIVPPRAKTMALLQEMSEKHDKPTYPDWKEDLHEALVGSVEWLRRPEVTEQFLGLLPKLKELIKKPDFTTPSRGAVSLLETQRSTQASVAQMVSSVGQSIERMAAAVNSTMGQPAYPLKYRIPDDKPINPFGFLEDVVLDVQDHLNPTYGYTLMSKQFASFDYGLHPLDDDGLQLDFTFQFENLWGPHSIWAPKWGFTKPKHIRVIPGIQLSYRDGRGMGIGGKVEMFTWWWCERKEVTVAWAAFSATAQRKPLVLEADHVYVPVGKIKWGGGAVFKQRRFLYDILDKAVTPISLEHKTLWLAGKAKNTAEIRFSEMLKNPVNTGNMELFMWDVFADVHMDPLEEYFEHNITIQDVYSSATKHWTKESFPEVTVRAMFNLPAPKRGPPQW